MLETCAAPLRDKPLDAIRTDSVLAVLAPNLADKELGPVDVQREAMIAAARWMVAV